jgi:hypothetical protein
MRRQFQCRNQFINGFLLTLSLCLLFGAFLMLYPQPGLFANFFFPSEPCIMSSKIETHYRTSRPRPSVHSTTEQPSALDPKQLHHLCPDVVETRYDQAKIAQFMRRRKKFYLQLTDSYEGVIFVFEKNFSF